MKRTLLTLLLIIFILPCGFSTQKEDDLKRLYTWFRLPPDYARTKLWWFFGETKTSREGITADLEAFKRQGVGGVVYYDQVHGKGEGADQVFSSAWWDHLIFAAQEAQRLGLSFEANVGNGYVAGGKWITPDHSMQRLATAEVIATSVGPRKGGLNTRLPLPHCPQDWHEDVAVYAIPYQESLLGDSHLSGVTLDHQGDTVFVFDFHHSFTARSITYTASAQGKARTSSMQVPPTHKPLLQNDPTRFYGCGFKELPDIAVLEASDDAIHYKPICHLPPRYQNLGGVKQQTIAFPTTVARYFRITVKEPVKLTDIVVSARARVNRWEEKASLVSDYITGDATPHYQQSDMISSKHFVDVTDKLSADGTLTWMGAPAGKWLIMRIVAVSTGGHTKHGRAEALGLECDKLSKTGAQQHWLSYTKPVIDSIRTHGAKIEGICMDSHEAGPQNWTHDMPHQFFRLRGYVMKPFLPTMAAGILSDKAVQFLYDLRRTISDLITTEYYGEFARLCYQERLTLTAQAIGGALCLAGDQIEVKKWVDKPQGEFWGYQTEGNYDIKDCSSAAHVYGKRIASGEAFTDITYKHTLSDIKTLADYAYCFGINEFVVCASAYQDDVTGHILNTANGRQYVLNRLNTLWPVSSSFWDYQARCSWLLQQGKPVNDLCLYLGDNVPKRILSHLLPDIPQGYDYDAFTTDVLLHRMKAEHGRIILPDGICYQMLLLPPDEELTPAAQRQIELFRQEGVAVWDPRSGQTLKTALQQAGVRPDVEVPDNARLYYTHRRTDNEDIYFLDNHSDEVIEGVFRFRTSHAHAELWDPLTGMRYRLLDNHVMRMEPRQSYFIIFSDVPSSAPVWTRKTDEHTIKGSWKVTFDPIAGGPSSSISTRRLTDWTQNKNPLIRYYSGTATYTKTIKVSGYSKKNRYLISFDGIGSAAEIYVNGQYAGGVWCSPWSLDVTPYLKKGKNDLKIRVANNLWNRLVGSATAVSNRHFIRQTYPLVKKDDHLMPSGLTGKVRLLELKP